MQNGFPCGKACRKDGNDCRMEPHHVWMEMIYGKLTSTSIGGPFQAAAAEYITLLETGSIFALLPVLIILMQE